MKVLDGYAINVISKQKMKITFLYILNANMRGLDTLITHKKSKHEVIRLTILFWLRQEP